MFLNNKKPVASIYISNISEDVWPFISAISDSQTKVFEIEENARLADRDLFTNADEENLLLILPSAPEPDFVNYYFNVFGKRQMQILVPKIHTGEICEDILKDQTIISQINQTASLSQKLEIISYSTSSQFLHLVKELKEKFSNITTPEAPEEEDAWTVNFFGSKSGIRQLAQQSGTHEPDFKMAEGLICMGIEDAAKIAANMYVNEDGVVIKTNKGHSGAGVLIFRPGDLPREYTSCVVTILDQFTKESYWNKFPIIIEKYIQTNISIGGGFPNVEFKILKNGRIEFLFFGGMRVTKEGVYKGMDIGNDSLSDRIAARIVDTGFYLAENLLKEGFRGHFDVDFIAAKNGELYVTESNVRRTGATHVYYSSLALFGKNFMHETYSLSNNLYQITTENINWNFRKLYQALESILFNKSTNEGLVIVGVNLLTQGRFGYIIFGKTKRRSLEIEAKMEHLLKHVTI